MNLIEARNSVGKLVMTTDPGHKMVRESLPHGPYKLLQVTKRGVCILEGYEEFRVPPTLIGLYTEVMADMDLVDENQNLRDRIVDLNMAHTASQNAIICQRKLITSKDTQLKELNAVVGECDDYISSVLDDWALSPWTEAKIDALRRRIDNVR